MPLLNDDFLKHFRRCTLRQGHFLQVKIHRMNILLKIFSLTGIDEKLIGYTGMINIMNSRRKYS